MTENRRTVQLVTHSTLLSSGLSTWPLNHSATTTQTRSDQILGTIRAFVSLHCSITSPQLIQYVSITRLISTAASTYV